MPCIYLTETMKKVAAQLRKKTGFYPRLICSFCVITVLGCFYYEFLRAEFSPQSADSNNISQPRGISVILLWTTFFGKADYYFGLGRQPFIDHNCSVNRCHITTNRSELVNSEAVVFHVRDLDLIDIPNPKLRKTNQRYVFFLLESPLNTFGVEVDKLNGFFNWTMTYRLDSDVLATYGKVISNQSVYVDRTKIKNRKLVVWLVSNCHSQSGRENYVNELSKYIQVDKFGKCGDNFCDKDCEKALFKSYKFYLSFENSLCKDYVTEKLFKVLSHDVVPVVYGFANYSALVPSRSYIDVRDFESPRELANYLKVLAANETAYEEYFAWKSSFRVENGIGHSFCSLCEQLQRENAKEKTYKDIYRWWYNGNETSDRSVCRIPEESFQFTNK